MEGLRERVKRQGERKKKEMEVEVLTWGLGGSDRGREGSSEERQLCLGWRWGDQ